MKDIDQIYQLFAEANPAPTTSALMTERPDADVILQEKRKPTMITQEPKALRPQPSA
nr:hypothetical protein [Desulfuromonadales bacterium]